MSATYRWHKHLYHGAGIGSWPPDPCRLGRGATNESSRSLQG